MLFQNQYCPDYFEPELLLELVVEIVVNNKVSLDRFKLTTNLFTKLREWCWELLDNCWEILSNRWSRKRITPHSCNDKEETGSCSCDYDTVDGE